jgi:hypothetical protein
MLSIFPAIDVVHVFLGTRLPAVLNPLFQRSMARVAPNVFGFVLTSLLDRMGSIPAETFIKVESTLEALSLLLTLQVPSKHYGMRTPITRT